MSCIGSVAMKGSFQSGEVTRAEVGVGEDLAEVGGLKKLTEMGF